MKIIEKIYDAVTGEETVTERDETVTERSEREKLEKENAERIAQAEAKAAARQAILDRLGLTEEEARLLLG